MPRTLLDITDDLLALDMLLEERGGDVSDPEVEAALSQWMNELQTDLVRKVDNYLALLAAKQGRSSVRRAEEKRLGRLAQQEEREIEWLRSRLLMALGSRGIGRLETERYRVTVAAAGGRAPLVIDDPGAVPAALTREIPARRVPDGEAIRAALDRGETVPGARYGPRTRCLRVR